jgi:enoyl-CoA hydratase/carnithine racemase
MSERTINVTRKPEQPGALYVEFCNPEALNSYSVEMGNKLISTLRDAGRDDGVRVVILSGAGGKAFSSGLAMDQLNEMRCNDDYAVFYTLGTEIREAIYALGKPLVAAVTGLCVGGGFEITLCCDLVYATENSRFMLPEVNISLTPGCGGAINLPKKMPLNRAFEVMLFCERITAQEAKDWGIVNKIFPADTFWDEVGACVDKILARPPLAVRALKEQLGNTIISADERTALKIERRLALDLMGSEDFKEAVAAFNEKRTPVFKGK